MSTVMVSAYARPKLLQVTSNQLLYTEVSCSLHRSLHKGTKTSLSTTGLRALQILPRRGSRTCQNLKPLPAA